MKNQLWVALGEHPLKQGGEMGWRITENSSSWWEGAVPWPGDTVPGFAAPCCGVGRGTLLLPWLCLTTRSGPGKAGSAGGGKSRVISTSWTHPYAGGADVCVGLGWGWTAAQHCFPRVCSLQHPTKVSFCPCCPGCKERKRRVSHHHGCPGFGKQIFSTHLLHRLPWVIRDNPHPSWVSK